MESKHPLSGRKQSPEHIAKRVAAQLGQKRNKQQRERISQGKMGIGLSADSIAKRTETRRRNGWNKNPELTSKRMSENNAYANLGRKRSVESIRKFVLSVSGEKNHNWKGGISDANDRIRKSFEYQLWRKNVLERDNFTCQICGKRGGKLHVDHIKPFALFPKLRFDLDNGRVLCLPCHFTTETHGYRKMYRKQKI